MNAKDCDCNIADNMIGVTGGCYTSIEILSNNPQ